MRQIFYDLMLDLAPVPKGRPRVSPARFTVVGGRAVQTCKPHAYTPAATKTFEAKLGWELRRAKCIPRKGLIGLDLTFHTTGRADLDNYVKAFMDASNHILYDDDSQVIELHARLSRELPARIHAVVFAA